MTRIINQTKQTVIATEGRIADTVVSRLVGLLNRPSIAQREALVITQCRSIHMLFMRFAIDVIFVDGHDRIVGLVRNIKPFCISPYFWQARSAIELPLGVIDQSQSEIGDKVVIAKG